MNATKLKKKAASNQFGESELGQYLDRELAQAIVKATGHVHKAL